MAKASSPKNPSPGPTEAAAIRFNCILQIPKEKADKLLPHLGIALDCGSAIIKRRGRSVEVETTLDPHAMAAIADKDIPIIVTKFAAAKPISKDMLIDDPALWFEMIRREK